VLNLEIEVKKYYLPDARILENDNDFDYSVWRPDKTYVVLGRANNVAASLVTNNILEDNVEVLKRPSGGETVILTPNMLVYSAKMRFDKTTNTKATFSKINKSLIKHLLDIGIDNLSSKGISDLSIGAKKIAGSSMYLQKDIIFYHAVLNISENPSLISRYLRHPSKEPDYREGRSHEEFVTSLKSEGYDLAPDLLFDKITLALKELDN
jgi:lipoate-protein ligase A